MAQGLQAFMSGGGVAQAAISEIHEDAGDPDLLADLRRSNEQSEQWARRVGSAIEEVGCAEVARDGARNMIVEAHFETSRRMRREAPDDLSCDLGIIAMHQVALHYWIAAFGTLRTYARSAGMGRTAQDMQFCIDEAVQADRRSAELAEKLLAARR